MFLPCFIFSTNILRLWLSLGTDWSKQNHQCAWYMIQMILAGIILTLFMMLLEVMICITYCQFNLSLLILNFIKTFKHLCIIFLYYRLLHSCLPQHCTSLRISILTIVVSCIIIVMKYHITNNVRRNTIPAEPGIRWYPALELVDGSQKYVLIGSY